MLVVGTAKDQQKESVSENVIPCVTYPRHGSNRISTGETIAFFEKHLVVGLVCP